jgi:hypothetical protein
MHESLEVRASKAHANGSRSILPQTFAIWGVYVKILEVKEVLSYCYKGKFTERRNK